MLSVLLPCDARKRFFFFKCIAGSSKYCGAMVLFELLSIQRISPLVKQPMSCRKKAGGMRVVLIFLTRTRTLIQVKCKTTDSAWQSASSTSFVDVCLSCCILAPSSRHFTTPDAVGDEFLDTSKLAAEKPDRFACLQAGLGCLLLQPYLLRFLRGW